MNLRDFRRLLTLSSILCAASLFATKASGAVLLEIDISNPAAVTISATGGKPVWDDLFQLYSWGITLQNFFLDTTNGPSSSVVGNLAPGGTGGTLAFTESSKNGGYLILFNSSDEYAEMPFLAASPAFVGTATIDLSAYASKFSAVGYEGNIDSNFTIGTYRLIPEPSSILLGAFGAGALALGAMRYRRKV